MLGEIDSVVDECTVWIGQTLQKSGRSEEQGPEEWDGLVGQMLTNEYELETFALQGWKFVRKLMDALKKQRVTVEQISSKLIESQSSVVQLQEKLLEKQTDHISEIHTAVQSTVTSTVEKEIKCYSDAVKKNQSQKSATSVSLQHTVKEVVEQEDRSRNVMLFGLPDGENENTKEAVEPVLQTIGEKPRIMEVRRLGRYVPGTSRPVVLSVGSSFVASQIVRKRRLLRETAEFRTVYIAPDRSVAERKERRALVATRKEDRKDAEKDDVVVRELRGRTVVA